MHGSYQSMLIIVFSSPTGFSEKLVILLPRSTCTDSS